MRYVNGSTLAAALRRPVAASLLLLLVYIALAFVNDPRGYLGTDTGGKVATLEVMNERGKLDPDVGYWAEELDPKGDLHPLHFTGQIGERWVNITTLPMPYASAPLYERFGYRAVLIFPMLGSVLTALAARRIVQMVGTGSPALAFWVVGLASPLAIYALDFWEHSLGVAFVVWAAIALAGSRDSLSRRAISGFCAGALIGAGAVMRQEALVYGAVLCLAVGIPLVRRLRIAQAGTLALGVVVGMAIPWLSNQWLEEQTAGGVIRQARSLGSARGAVSTAGDSFADRAKEAVTTGFALGGDSVGSEALIAILVIALLVFLIRWDGDQSRRRFVVVAVAAVVALYCARLLSGLSFIPGLVATTPLAVAGVTLGWRNPVSRTLLVTALGALPIVWATQYLGGAGPQWGGRYILISGVLFAAVGIAHLPRIQRDIQVFLIALSVGITLFGLTLLAVRSHDVGDFGQVIAQRDEEVLISRVPHLFRETGVHYREDRHWLIAESSSEERKAFRVAEQAGADAVGLVRIPRAPASKSIGKYRLASSERVEFLLGVELEIATYRTGR